MVAAPLSTIDMATPSGDQVEIEYRSEDEIIAGKYTYFDNVTAWNPVFDVTPADLVDAIVTEKGVVLAPDKNKLQKLFSL